MPVMSFVRSTQSNETEEQDTKEDYEGFSNYVDTAPDED